ncbi:MAG: 3-phosphate cyclase [Schlesneria sp.]|nr:3-phosphate cyclase [Schlesneria sp.]
MSDPINIDGSQGEGGGQIVRSSLALSMVTGRPVTIDRVRAGRAKPGLKQQHLTALRAAQEICRATVTGDTIGSSSFTFHPGDVVPGNYHFAIGTAGSATLVLQAILPPLLIAQRPSRLILEGGTHNPWAPPFDFLQRSYLSLVNRMGPQVTATLERPGFYPAGGGRFIVEIEPAKRAESLTHSPGAPGDLGLSNFHLLERGEIRSRIGRVLLCNLPDHIADRELEELARLDQWEPDCLFRENIKAHGPGNAIVIEVVGEHVIEVFIGIGEQGTKGEVVAQRAFEEMREYLVANVPIGPHLADQLLLPMALSAWQSDTPDHRREGSFRTVRLTDHSKTHIKVLQAFLGTAIVIEEEAQGDTVIVKIGG